MVHDLVATMRDSLHIGRRTVNRHKPARQAVHPVFSAVVREAVTEGIEQKATFVFRSHLAFKEHI